jgi:hypothetical protein
MRKTLLGLFAALAIFSSCSKDDDSVATTKLAVKVEFPTDYSDAKAEGIEVNLKNATSGIVYKAKVGSNSVAEAMVESGTYTISVESKQTVKTSLGSGNAQKEFTQEIIFRGLTEGVSVVGKEFSVAVSLTPSMTSGGFIIKEAYFAGVSTPLNKTYWKDQYIELYNNSDKELYADGLSICEVDFTTTLDVNPWAELVKDGVVVNCIYTIPGSGKEVLVKPGQSIVLANIAMDHRKENANSIDLTKANYEWYDKSSIDVDVPEVPNLIPNHVSSNTLWVLHQKGYRGYLIFQEAKMADFITANTVKRTVSAGKDPLIRVKIPYDRIIDGVELSHPSAFKQKALPVSVDASYTYIDASNSGLCVRRKVEKRVNERVVYKDTNNSAKDFEINQKTAPGVNI